MAAPVIAAQASQMPQMQRQMPQLVQQQMRQQMEQQIQRMPPQMQQQARQHMQQQFARMQQAQSQAQPQAHNQARQMPQMMPQQPTNPNAAPALDDAVKAQWTAARTAFWQRDMDKTVELYKALVASTDLADVAGELGNVYMMQGDQEGAKAMFSEAADRHLKSATPMNAGAVMGVLMRLDPDKAKEVGAKLNALQAAKVAEQRAQYEAQRAEYVERRKKFEEQRAAQMAAQMAAMKAQMEAAKAAADARRAAQMSAAQTGAAQTDAPAPAK